jgi:hypothetical protein
MGDGVIVGPELLACLTLFRLLLLLLNKTFWRAAGLHTDPCLCGTGKLNYDVLSFDQPPLPLEKGEKKITQTTARGWRIFQYGATKI